MGEQSRLNILLTHGGSQRTTGPEPWFRLLSQLLTPLGVKTFEAANGSQAMDLIEKVPIHLAVVDTRLPALSGMNVLRLVQRIRDAGESIQIKPFQGVNKTASQPEMDVINGSRRVPVNVTPDTHPRPRVISPAVILLTPTRSDQLMHEALKFNAFSVLTEPVDLDLMLDLMARAMKRFHDNQWPM